MLGYDKSQTIGGGTSMGVDFVKNNDGSTNYNVNAPSRTNVKYGMTDREQIARATVGAGTITVGGKQLAADDPSLSGLNRDTSKGLEVTKDKKIDLIDVDVDHRLLTDKGREQIKEEINTASAAVKDYVVTAKDVLTGEIDNVSGKNGAGELLAERFNREDAMAALAKTDPKAAEILANKDGNYSIEDKQAASSAYNELLLTKYGLTPEEIKDINVYDNKEDGNKGFRDTGSDTIHINAGNTDLGKDEYAEVLSHEQAHTVDAALGYDYTTDKAGSEKHAEYMEEAGFDSMNNGLSMAGTDYRMGELDGGYNKKLEDYIKLIGNTSKANTVPLFKREPAYVYIWNPGSTPTGNSAFGHAAIKTDDGNYLSHFPLKDGLPNYLKSNFHDEARDVKEFGRPADFQYYIKLPDEKAASSNIDKIKQYKYWSPWQNCTTGVEDSLNAGGFPTNRDLIDRPSTLNS